MTSSAAAGFGPLALPKEAAITSPIAEANTQLRTSSSDELLLTQIAAGDQDAVGVLFKRYAQLTRSVAVRILRDTAEAEDLVQDLFIFIQRRCSIFDSSKSSARSWIIQMAYHRAIERRRYLTTRHFYSQGDVEALHRKMVGIATTETDYSADAVLGRNGLETLFNACPRTSARPCGCTSLMDIPSPRSLGNSVSRTET